MTTPNDALIEEVRAMVERLTRPVIGGALRTSQEMFDIMADRILHDSLITRLMEGRG